MQEQNSEYGGGKRIEYRKHTCAFRGYVFLSEWLNGESDAAADYRERQHCSPFGTALRHTQILKYESSYKSEDGDKEKLIYRNNHKVVIFSGNIGNYD